MTGASQGRGRAHKFHLGFGLRCRQGKAWRHPRTAPSHLLFHVYIYIYAACKKLPFVLILLQFSAVGFGRWTHTYQLCKSWRFIIYAYELGSTASGFTSRHLLEPTSRSLPEVAGDFEDSWLLGTKAARATEGFWEVQAWKKLCWRQHPTIKSLRDAVYKTYWLVTSFAYRLEQSSYLYIYMLTLLGLENEGRGGCSKKGWV